MKIVSTVLYRAHFPDKVMLSSRYPTCDLILTGDDFDYWRGMEELWGTDATLVNVEHDMEFSDHLVAELLDCPHPLCSYAYQCHIPRTFWAHYLDGRGMSGTNVPEGAEWAAWSAIGFCKIAPEIRTRPLAQNRWIAVESSVNTSLRKPWHLHWPAIAHYHPNAETPATTPPPSS